MRLPSLSGLMKKHGYSKNDLIALLQDEASDSGQTWEKIYPTETKATQIKIFRNPETGETVETRGGNHAILKSWRAEYRLNNIDDWLIDTKIDVCCATASPRLVSFRLPRLAGLKHRYYRSASTDILSKLLDVIV